MGFLSLGIAQSSMVSLSSIILVTDFLNIGFPPWFSGKENVIWDKLILSAKVVVQNIILLQWSKYW